jgi:hypothetical protein
VMMAWHGMAVRQERNNKMIRKSKYMMENISL